MIACVGLVFFFFKQKTAYEMRISDWSSDVCSSDLVLDGVGADLLDHRVEAAIDAEIISGNLNHRFLVGIHEGDVRGPHLGFDQQGVLDRHDLHQILPGLDHAADGAHLAHLHGDVDWRAYLCTLYAIPVRSEERLVGTESSSPG